MAASTVPRLQAEPSVPNRRIQLCAGMIAMMAIAMMQYAWTPFTKSLAQTLNAPLSAVQLSAAQFILATTWLVPFEGDLIDPLGRRKIAIYRVQIHPTPTGAPPMPIIAAATMSGSCGRRAASGWPFQTFRSDRRLSLYGYASGCTADSSNI